MQVCILLVNLIVACIIQNFEVLQSEERWAFNPEQIDVLLKLWGHICDTRGTISHRQLVKLMRSLPPPLGLGRHATNEESIQVIDDMQIAAVFGQRCWFSVLGAAMLYICCYGWPPGSQHVWHTMWVCTHKQCTDKHSLGSPLSCYHALMFWVAAWVATSGNTMQTAESFCRYTFEHTVFMLVAKLAEVPLPESPATASACRMVGRHFQQVLPCSQTPYYHRSRKKHNKYRICAFA